jgi:hypothetical protein
MSEAQRLNTGKPELSYILTFPRAAIEFAKVCMYGANKYERGNYLRVGKPLSEYADCLLRHLTAWLNGEDTDPESECNHLGHVVWNALALCQFALSKNSIDDRINEEAFK